MELPSSRASSSGSTVRPSVAAELSTALVTAGRRPTRAVITSPIAAGTALGLVPGPVGPQQLQHEERIPAGAFPQGSGRSGVQGGYIGRGDELADGVDGQPRKLES